jgi:hypothetical protein
VVAGLQQEPGGLRVVLLGGDVQRRKANFAAGVVLQQDGDNLGSQFYNLLQFVKYFR